MYGSYSCPSSLRASVSKEGCGSTYGYQTSGDMAWSSTTREPQARSEHTRKRHVTMYVDVVC